MIDGTYAIVMQTPMGLKKGRAILHQHGNRVSGRLALLDKSNTFENGTVNGNQYVFSGELKTAIGKVAYTVEGSIEGDGLNAVAKTVKGNLVITGTSIHKRNKKIIKPKTDNQPL
jgi:hypothetical protein